MKILRYLPPLLGLLLAALACSLASPTPAEMTRTPLSATQVSSPTYVPTPAPLPTQPPTPPPPTAPPPLPSGFIANVQQALSFYDLDGTEQTQLRLPNQADHALIQPAGPWWGGAPVPPVVYYTYEDQGALKVYQASQSATLVDVENLLALIGAPGAPVVAYTVFDYQNNVAETKLYVTDFNNIPSATPVLTEQDPEGWTLRPLALTMANGQARGVWYTRFPWGIGGDIVFEPRNQLYYLDLETGATTEHLGAGTEPWGPSPDQTWVAYTQAIEQPVYLAQAGAWDNPLSLPLLPDSDRGAGDACFAPDNAHVAWMEGSGSLMAEIPNFHTTIRIATIAGQTIVNVPAADLSASAGFGAITWAQPVGWLDNDTLLIQVHGPEWEQAAVLQISADGQNPLQLANGQFVGFTYP